MPTITLFIKASAWKDTVRFYEKILELDIETSDEVNGEIKFNLGDGTWLRLERRQHVLGTDRADSAISTGVTLRVNNIQAAYDDFISKSVTIDRSITELKGTRQFTFRDPSDNLLSIVEVPGGLC